MNNFITNNNISDNGNARGADVRAVLCLRGCITETINHLKNVFWPNLCVDPAVQLLKILKYSPQGHFLQAPAGCDTGSS